MLDQAEKFVMEFAGRIAGLFMDPGDPSFIIAQMMIVLLMVPLGLFLCAALSKAGPATSAPKTPE
ncbi:MAG: hypothetical protein Q7T86_17210 [Hyphomicrobiaceae bacterium]|nr:hypothetical protein [Hyphomicrobiaceae bacterium]